MSNRSNNTLYRPEIDGLRAFAVIAVIINHFDQQFLSNGFLGVDIFFVISGFVITSSLSNREITNFFEFISGFYARRIKRIIPALIIFVCLVSVLICFFNPYSSEALITGGTSLLGLSNIYLLKISTNYFAESTQLNPFTNTWSLGVEEQFYFLYPLLIWFSGYGKKTRNGHKNLLITLSFLTTISLLAFIYFYNVNQPLAYFSMPTRFWEIAVGCILFLVLQKKKSFSKNLNLFLSLFSLFIILIILFLPFSTALYSTLLVVFFTILLIATLRKNQLLYKLFASRSVVFIGLISYSLYLWHWGILSISRWTIGISFYTVPFQIILILLISVFFYLTVEKPLRTIEWSKNNLYTLLKGLVILFTISFPLLNFSKFLEGKFYLGKNNIDLNDPYYFPNIDNPNCIKKDPKNTREILVAKCYSLINKAKRTLFFAGDSHTQALLNSAEFISNEINSNFSYIVLRATVPNINSQKIISNLIDIDSISYEIINNVNEKDILIITNLLPGRFFKDWHIKGKRNSMKSNFNNWINTLDMFLANLSKKNVKVIMLNSTPDFPNAINLECESINPQWFNKLGKKECKIPLDEFQKNNKIYSYINKKLDIQKLKHENFFVFDALTLMCPNSSCNYSLNDELLYRDNNHLSSYAARNIIAPNLIEFIRKNNL